MAHASALSEDKSVDAEQIHLPENLVLDMELQFRLNAPTEILYIVPCAVQAHLLIICAWRGFASLVNVTRSEMWDFLQTACGKYQNEQIDGAL